MLSFSVDDSEDNSGYDERKHTNYNIQVRDFCIAAGVFILLIIVKRNKKKTQKKTVRKVVQVFTIYTEWVKIAVSL